MNSSVYYSKFPEHRLKVSEAGDRRDSPEAPGASGQGAGMGNRGCSGGAFCGLHRRGRLRAAAARGRRRPRAGPVLLRDRDGHGM